MPTIAENESIIDEVFFDQTTEPNVYVRYEEEIRKYFSAKLELNFLRKPGQIEPDEGDRGQRIGVNRVLSFAFRQNKRQYGRGLVGRWLNRRMTRKRINSHVIRQLDTFNDHRSVSCE